MNRLIVMCAACALSACTARGPAMEPFAATEPEAWLPDNIRTSMRARESRIARVEGTRVETNDGVVVDGEVRFYDADDNLMSVSHYERGVSNGDSTLYYAGGAVQQRRHYVQGKPNGVFETYFENGWIKSRSVWRHGKLIGPSQGFHANGTLHTLEVYDDDGRRIGGFRRWDDSGSELSRSIVKDGRHLMEYSLTDEGELEMVLVYLNEGHIVTWYPKQEKQRVLFFQEGEDHEMPVTLPIVDWDD